MKLKEFSKYNIELKHEKLFVYNKNKCLKPISDRYHNNKWYVLRDDKGNKRSISELRIAFAIKHDIAPSEISKSYRFYGTVCNPIIGVRDKKTTLGNVAIDQLLLLEKSLDMMKYAYYSNDYSAILRFAYDNKKCVIGAVSKRIGVGYKTLEEYWDYGMEIFIESIKNMSFTSLKPMMNYLCTCLKYGYIRNKRPKYEII